jgi:hypothetical protein
MLQPTGQQVQRHGCKGVISQPVPEKLSAGASLSERSLKEILSLVNAFLLWFDLHHNHEGGKSQDGNI